ncbi:MAG TPA: TIGR02677 family protein [Solirubrobacteraceae bacterium]|nr:TIGR02677 family protein [Solirubrobacteraceae bacterium]
MSLELPPGVFDAAADVLGLHDRNPTADAPAEPRSQRFEGHSVLRYAAGEEATDDYRHVMRALYLEHQAFGLRLRRDEIAGRLRERFGYEIADDVLDRRLDQLHEWRAVDREHDASLASTAAEWRRNRYTYDVTRAGRLTETLLQQLDRIGADHGALDASRIANILDALDQLVAGLERERPDGAGLRRSLEALLAEVAALHAGALTFMKDLGALVRRAEHVDEDEFARSKGALIDHLQGFRRDRRRRSQHVLAALGRVETLGVDRMIALIADAQELVELPGGSTVAEQRAHRREELSGRWHGVRAWFGDDGRTDSPWQTLDAQVVAAVQAVLEIAERLIERRSSRVDRAQVHLRLAALAAAAAPGDAPAWVRAALGIRSPRHLGVGEADPAQVRDRGRTSWRAAPPAPVVAHLRRPGRGSPGRGRGAPIPDLSEARRALAAQRRAERAELDAVLARFAGAGPLRMSHLRRVDAREFVHLLAWIGRAYEVAPAADGTRRAASTDGRTSIRLRPPAQPAPTVALATPAGTLRLPDFVLEVQRR